MKKKILICLLCFTMAVYVVGCGKDLESNPLNDNTDTSAENNDDLTAKYTYVEKLESGTYVCPKFPEVQDLAYVDEQFLLDSICPSIVRLECGDLFGSGVIWQMAEDCIIIITNQHVIAESDADGLLEVVFWDGIRAHGEILSVSDKYDLGFIKVNLNEMGYYTVDRYYQARYDVDVFETLNPGEDIFIIGSADYPAGNLYYGTIGNKSIYMDIFNTNMLWAYCEVKAGMSGSGVFDRYGNLIGIVCAGNEEKEAAVLAIQDILSESERI